MENHQTNWRDLIRAAQAGDSAAITEFIERTQKSLFIFCFHLAKNRQFAEDLTHDAYIKALRSLHQLENPDAILAWLKKISRSLFLDQLRSRKNESVQSLKEVSEIETALSVSAGAQEIAHESAHESELNSLTDRMAALQALKQLSEEDQAILILIDIQGGSYSEASQVLDIPEGTVKSRLSRARQKFSFLFQGTK